MFLNLPTASRNKRLSSDFGLPRSKSFLSTLNNSLNNNNQQRSYSTASLKEQFRQFKNKSLSYGGASHSHSVSMLQQHDNRQQQQQHTPGKKQQPMIDRGSYINNVIPSTSTVGSAFGTASGLKVNDFKKTYLNLDSKLSKTTKKEKDYFRQQQQQQQPPQPIYQHHQRYTSPHAPPQPPPPSFTKKQPIIPYPSTYLQVQKKLQQQNQRRSVALINQLKQLRELNQLLKIQNQQLKKQRAIDLDLIARQNEIMQKQQELIEANQQAIYINRLSSPNRNNDSMADSRSLVLMTPPPIPPCEQCKKRNSQQSAVDNSNQQHQSCKVELEFMTLKVEKMQQQKKLLKSQLHDLVYQSEKLKQQLKLAQQKYQKQSQHNQKLLHVIENRLDNKQQLQKNKSEQVQGENQQKDSGINRQPYLNLLSSYEIQDLSSNEPISIKKERVKNQQMQQQQQQQMQQQQQIQQQQPSELSSPTMRNLNVSDNYKNSINIIKFTNNRDQHNEIERRLSRNDNENDQNRNINYEKDKAKSKESQLYLQKLEKDKQRERAKVLEISRERQSLLKRQIERRKEKNHEWCQNENIRKYLNEINRQKIKQIDQIESLLRNE